MYETETVSGGERFVTIRHAAGGLAAATVTSLVLGTSFVPSAMAAAAVAAPPGVDVAGTVWVQVSTAGELEYIDENPGGYLTANIELMNTIDLPNGYSWSPLGTSSNPFDGVFNGNGYEVTNVSVTGSFQYAGFFGVSGGIVENVGVNGNFSSNDTGSYVGGLVADETGGSISDSYATGSVSGSHGSFSGGLVGQSVGAISDSYATVSVSGSHGSFKGGLVGQDVGAISDSYATGSVSGYGGINGGLVGWQDGGAISDSYATGSVSDYGNSNGGLVAALSSGTISDSYFDKDTTGMLSGVGSVSSSGVSSESTADMKTPSTFSSWSSSDWALLNGYYPLLSWQIGTTMSVTPTVVGAGGPVTVMGSVYSNSGGPLSGINVSLTSPSGTWAQSSAITDTTGGYIGLWTAPNTTQDATVTATVYGTTIQQQNTVQVQAYTVTYKGNGATGGTVPTDSNTYVENQTTTVLGNTGSLVKTGYTFAGWNTEANGSGTSYDAGNALTMGSSNITLYAQWTANTYSLSYDGNGSTGGSVPGGSNQAYNTTVTVSGNTGSLVKTGYTFAGWNTEANGSGTSYDAGNTLTMGSSNITLYAQWTANRVVVRPTPPFINTARFPEDAKVGELFSAQLVATGGSQPFTWSITNGVLPNGLTLNSQGVISGTPTGQGGQYTFTVEVTDANNLTATSQMTLAVDGPTSYPSITTTSLRPGFVGQWYQQTLAANGGTAPYMWRVIQGTLPSGFSLNAQLGELTGTPSKSGVYTATVQATDAAGLTTTQTFSIDILRPDEREIMWNGQIKNVPAFVGNDGGSQTTYMPIWYVMQLLKPMGIQSKWNGTSWHMTTSVQLDLSNVIPGHGKTGIYLNGVLVLEANTKVEDDPWTNRPTTYMPIWYVMQLLERVGLTSTWNGITWTVTK